MNTDCNNKVGRPRIEDKQPGLKEALINVAIHGSAVHDKRQTTGIRSCKTLTDLQKALTDMGFEITRSTVYLRLMARTYLSLEGRRHVDAVPVRLCRAQNDIHNSHPDSQFCVTSIRYVETLASFLGAEQTGFISQDDKARVPIGNPLSLCT